MRKQFLDQFWKELSLGEYRLLCTKNALGHELLRMTWIDTWY